jgi:formylglycine-generating enzyme required for sulfatase activity
MTPGSPDYMAPEQVLGGRLTGRMDQYALAGVVYEALAGALPFRADTPLAVLFKKHAEAPRPLADAAPQVPPGAAAAVMRAMSKDPQARFEVCADLARAFRDGLVPPRRAPVLAEPAPAPGAAPKRAPSPPPPASRAPVAPVAPAARRPRWRIAAVIALLAGGAALGAVALGVFDAKPVGPHAPPPAPLSAAPPAAPAAVDRVAPTLEVTSPSEESVTVSSALFTLVGRATDDDLSDVLVEGSRVPLGPGGEFRVPIALDEGVEKAVVVEAVDGAGNRSAKLTRRLRYVKPRAAWEAPLAAATAAGRAAEWERARVELSRAKEEDAPSVAIPAWLADGVAAYDAAPVLDVMEPRNGAQVSVGARVPVSGRMTSGRTTDRVEVLGKAVPLTDGRFATEVEMKTVGAVTIQVRVVDRGTERAKVERRVDVAERASSEQLAAAKALGIPVSFENSIGMRFVLIPAGEFDMGSPDTEEGRDADEVLHRVKLTRAYYMQVTEVSNAQFGRFRPEHTRYEGLDRDDQPVVMVNHAHATAFATWLTSQEKNRTYRLPTEAEWEYAARAGTRTPFWNGATISTDQANYDGSIAYGGGAKGVSRGTTLPVGSFPANPWGLHDMHGNVWEWVADWYGGYPKDAVTDPTGPASETHRIMRGGAWFNEPKFTRAAFRDRRDPATQKSHMGFRLVAEAR